MQLQLLAIPRVASLLDLAKLTISHWAYGHRPAPEGFPKPIRVGRQLRCRLGARCEEQRRAKRQDQKFACHKR